jgi:putative SOS response-associated peptidase YedK
MCGRFALTSDESGICEYFRVNLSSPIKPRFNIAPSQKLLVIRLHSETHEHTSSLVRWGLIPSWAKDQSIGARLTNARSETACTKPSFRDSFRRRRCLIPATGFYEWSTLGGKKQPYYVRLTTNEPFGIGGLWDVWEQNGDRIETCTVLTCDANQAMQHLHPRMPVVIQPERYDAWLDPSQTDAAAVFQDLHPFPEERTAIYPVSEYVNNVHHEDSRCQEQIDPAKTSQSCPANQLSLFDR